MERVLHDSALIEKVFSFQRFSIQGIPLYYLKPTIIYVYKF